jgi:hypothetical protein
MVQSITAAGICALAYSCGTYASLITAPQLLVSEAKGVWMIYNLPVAVAAYFRRREILWRSVSTGLAVILVVVMIVVSGDFRVTEIWRYLMTLFGVWVMGRVVSGIVLGGLKCRMLHPVNCHEWLREGCMERCSLRESMARFCGTGILGHW